MSEDDQRLLMEIMERNGYIAVATYCSRLWEAAIKEAIEKTKAEMRPSDEPRTEVL